MPKPHPPTHHHISRIDHPEKCDHAWLVQIQYCRKATKHRFSDRPHGGKRKALQAAIHFRDAILSEVKERNYPRPLYYRKRRDNTSGIVGIARYLRTDPRKPRMNAPYWVAFWNDANGQRHSRRFSVKLHGEAQAKALALNAREEAIRAMSPKPHK